MGKSKKKTLTSSPPPLPAGTGVIVFRPNHLKSIRADVISYNGKTEEYEIKLRGAPSSRKQTIMMTRRDEFAVINEDDDRIEYRGNECHRKELFKLESKYSPPATFIQDRVTAIELADKIVYSACCDYRTPDESIHSWIPIIQEYYLSQTWHWPLPKHLCAHVVLSLKVYVDETMKNPFHIQSFVERMLTPDNDEDDILTHILGCTVYAILGSVGSGQTENMLTSQIDALWCAFSILENNDKLQTAVIKRFKEIEECGKPLYPEFTYKHLLWSICCLYIQRSKDRRVLFHLVDSYRNPIAIDRLVICAETAIRTRPDSPHSYFNAAYLLMDTQEMCTPVDGAIRYQCAYDYAMLALQRAQKYGDPFYLYQCHALVAYWKMTSAHKNPYTLDEIRQHIRLAEEQNEKCISYTTAFDKHRASQTKQYVLTVLKSWEAENPAHRDSDFLS